MHRLGTAGQTGSIKFVTRITHPDHITNNSRHKSHNSESPGMLPTFIFLAKACCALHVYCVLRTRDSYLDNITTFRCYSSTHLSHTAKYNCHRANQISNIIFFYHKRKSERPWHGILLQQSKRNLTPYQARARLRPIRSSHNGSFRIRTPQE